MQTHVTRFPARIALSVLTVLALIAGSSTVSEAGGTTVTTHGNFTCYSGLALTIGGWGSAKKGKNMLDAADPDWRVTLNDLCLVDADGQDFELDLNDTFQQSYNEFRAWMRAPIRGNMAYMLSKQMVGTVLNVEVGDLSFIDEPWVTWEGNKVKLWDLIDDASDLVCQYPNTRGGNAQGRAEQETYKDFFDAINNNLIPVCENNGPPATTEIRVFKFYDLNLNGTWDSGEVAIPNWEFELYDSTGTTLINNGFTDSQGMLTFTVPQDSTGYVVEEVLLEPYVNISPLSQSVTANQNQVDLDFGNVAIQCHFGLGRTLGFWSNPNGKSTAATAFPDWVNILNSYNLVDLAGAPVSLSTANNDTAHSDLNSFLLGANASNMASMLSAQMAAVMMDVIAGDMSSHPGIFVDWDGEIVNIWDVFDEADQLLASHPVTINASVERTAQEELKDFFDAINNNTEHVYVVLPGPVSFGALPCVGSPPATD